MITRSLEASVLLALQQQIFFFFQYQQGAISDSLLTDLAQWIPAVFAVVEKQSF